tara:strand:- start:904 stop:1167 length:264 start_codon:yes stop_codon:yes gene_type:complete
MTPRYPNWQVFAAINCFQSLKNLVAGGLATTSGLQSDREYRRGFLFCFGPVAVATALGPLAYLSASIARDSDMFMGTIRGAGDRKNM